MRRSLTHGERVSDLRAPQKALHVYADTHSDDVSTLAFHPTIEELLLSGAMDGLISTIDVRIADEDDAILHTANVGASLSRVGWMPLAGKGWQGTFALTNMETLAVYDASDEVCGQAAPQLFTSFSFADDVLCFRSPVVRGPRVWRYPRHQDPRLGDPLRDRLSRDKQRSRSVHRNSGVS